MKLVLCTRPMNIGAWLLRAAMWSKWSHSAIYDEERELVYATTFWGGGCKVHAAADFFAHYTRHDIRDLPVPAEKLAEARAWLEAQLGKKYDWTALLSFVVHRDWSDDDRWFCSEHAEAFISQYATPRFRSKASRVTPQHQDMLL